MRSPCSTTARSSQQGTHEELLGEPDGKYYELWNAQAQYYTEESA